MERKLYQSLASKAQARLNCIESGNSEWENNHESDILEMVENQMPSGSGIDSGTQIDLDRSTGEKLVFTTAYHVMDSNGYYDGWIHPITVTVRPSLQFGYDLNITGRFGSKHQDLKDYLHETFSFSLDTMISE